MGFRFILLIIAIVIVWLILRHLMSRKNIPDNKSPVIEQKVRSCNLCGVHIHESEGIIHDPHFFCCAEHKQQYLQNNSPD